MQGEPIGIEVAESPLDKEGRIGERGGRWVVDFRCSWRLAGRGGHGAAAAFHEQRTQSRLGKGLQQSLMNGVILDLPKERFAGSAWG